MDETVLWPSRKGKKEESQAQRAVRNRDRKLLSWVNQEETELDDEFLEPDSQDLEQTEDADEEYLKEEQEESSVSTNGEDEEEEEEEEEEEKRSRLFSDSVFPTDLLSLLEQFVSTTVDYPDKFVGASGALSEQLKCLLCALYNYGKRVEPVHTEMLSPFKELPTEGFDDEQLWEMLQLQTVPLVKLLTQQSNALTKQADSIELQPLHQIQSAEDDGPQQESQDDSEAQEEEDNELEEELDDIDDDSRPVRNGDSQDIFFNLEAMEDWLDAEEEKDMEEEEEDQQEVDGEDNDDDDELLEDETEAAKLLKYDDFFDEPEEGRKKKKRRVDDEFEIPSEILGEEEQDDDTENLNNLKEKLKIMQSEESNQDETTMSAYQKRMQKLQKQITALEEQLVADKPWMLRGEISSTERPKNSLLEVVLDYDHTSKPPPVITEETTSAIEDIIKKRIKESSWDDVVRKRVETKKTKERIELSQEKSKVGLAEIYEKDYLKQVTGVSEEDEKLSQAHREIINMYRGIAWHLDRLAHFHYVPKPQMEIEKQEQNVPAIQMEEKLPTAISEASTLAPEEVYSKQRREVKAPNELSQEERKRLRQEKKRIKKRTKLEKEEQAKQQARSNPGRLPSIARAHQELAQSKSSGVHIANENDKSSTPTTSTALFAQLQQEVTHGSTDKGRGTEMSKQTGKVRAAKLRSLQLKL